MANSNKHGLTGLEPHVPREDGAGGAGGAAAVHGGVHVAAVLRRRERAQPQRAVRQRAPATKPHPVGTCTVEYRDIKLFLKT